MFQKIVVCKVRVLQITSGCLQFREHLLPLDSSTSLRRKIKWQFWYLTIIHICIWGHLVFKLTLPTNPFCSYSSYFYVSTHMLGLKDFRFSLIRKDPAISSAACFMRADSHTHFPEISLQKNQVLPALVSRHQRCPRRSNVPQLFWHVPIYHWYRRQLKQTGTGSAKGKQIAIYLIQETFRSF